MARTKTLRIPWGVFKVKEDLECYKWLDLWYRFLYADRKICTTDCLLRHVCLSVRMDQLGFHWADIHEV